MTAETCIAVGKLRKSGRVEVARSGANARVVGRLGHVDVVIGVHGRLATKHTTKHLDRPVRDDLPNAINTQRDVRSESGDVPH